MPIFESDIVKKSEEGHSTTTLVQDTRYYLAAAMALLYKYSGAREESVVHVDVQYHPLKIVIAPTDTLADVYDKIPSDIETHFTGYPLAFKWYNDYPYEEQYQGKLVSLNDDISIEFNIPDNSFYGFTLKDAPAHFEAILSSVKTLPTVHIGDIVLLDDNRIRQLEQWGKGRHLPLPQDITTLHGLFRKRAMMYATHTAVQQGERTMTYAELDALSDKIALYFIQKGLNKGDGVGILLPRGIEAYATMLGALKAGCFYIPLDKKFPPERIEHICKDANLNVLVSETHVLQDVNILLIDELLNSVNDINTPVSTLPADVLPTDVAYMIYTSGSTGQPKGVVIQHKAIVNLVLCECDYYKVQATDRVAQGLSLAFDASLEEIWMGFANGAALFPMADATVQSPEDLVRFLQEHRITFFSTVPSLLSMLHDDLPHLRILILGGEACPDSLLQRWHTPSRAIYNTYGPTETTVICTAQKFEPGVTVTIGKPIPNYAVYVVDEALNPVPVGVPGELCIAGASVAMGYNHKAALTAAKFCSLDWVSDAAFANPVYRSGDLVRWNANNEIEFLGRTDYQVKLRGYRIELGEIEKVLLRYEGIRLAAVQLTTDANQVKQLTSYIVCNKDVHIGLNDLKQWLAQYLPAYMVPAVYVFTDYLPLLPSGKVDRKRLDEVKPLRQEEANAKDVVLPATLLEQSVYDVWKKYLPGETLSTTDNFFDLGGHSLLAALIISELRNTPAFAYISVGDIYTYPTITQLAKHVSDAQTNADPVEENAPGVITKVGRFTKFAVQTLQILSQLLFYSLPASVLVFVYQIYEDYADRPILYRTVMFLCFIISMYPVYLVIGVVMKWLIIGKVKAGRYPLWGWYYFRFWLMRKFIDTVPLYFIQGTPFLVWYMRALGAHIGKRVYLNTDRIKAFDTLHIADDASLNKEVHLMGYTVEEGMLIIKPITIGERASVETRCVLTPGSTLANDVWVKSLTLIDEKIVTKPFHSYYGSPAKEEPTPHTDEVVKEPTSFRYVMYIITQFIAVFGALVFITFLSLPFIILTYDVLDALEKWYWVVAVLFASATVYIATYTIAVAILKWVLLGKVPVKKFSIYSSLYIRKWMVDILTYFSLLNLRQIYATLFLPIWLRMMGVKVGKMAEVSTLNQINTDALYIGAGSFLADSVSIGAPQVVKGMMEIKPTIIGARTFIGNGAVMAGGTAAGDNGLLGVMSTPPIDGRMPDGTDWLGSPSFRLPRRQPSQVFPEELTFKPPVRLIFLRAFIEYFKMTMPLVLGACVLIAFFFVFDYIDEHISTRIAYLVSPLLLFASCWLTVVFTVINKYLLIGRYKPGNHPLWSVFVWFNEYINGLCESVVNPMCVGTWLGTPFAPFVFRLLGSRIGKNTFLESTEITEFDLVHIGDNTCINFGVTLQTHLFEDRVMKKGTVTIDNDCSIGAMSVVLYNSHMHTHSRLESLSLLMKAESLASDTYWKGIPARRG